MVGMVRVRVVGWWLVSKKQKQKKKLRDQTVYDHWNIKKKGEKENQGNQCISNVTTHQGVLLDNSNHLFLGELEEKTGGEVG